MPIYKQTTEITNIDDLLSSVERDIEEVYFGDKQVFTVWNIYDGTLPAQYSANGSMLADYRIYGAAGGVGDDSGTAYGYGLNMSVKSINPVPPTSTWADGYYAADGSIATASAVSQEKCCLEYIPITEQTHYIFSASGGFPSGTGGAWRGYAFYDKNKNFISRYANTGEGGYDVYTPVNAAYCRLTMRTYGENFDTMLTEGSTPLPFQPYYNTTTSIYIGDEPLEAIGDYADYVDYQSGKIVRSVLNHIFTGTESTWRALYDWVELFANYSITPKIVVGSAVRSQSPDGNVTFQNFTYSGTPVIHITVDGISAGADIMPYLKSLYDNGTPAVMQYVSSEPVEVDPPVPLPTLPTVDGVNIVDYAGQSAARPNEFFAKYRKQNF